MRKGVPFRDAHEAVARAVRAAEQPGKDLAELPLEELRGFSPLVGEDVLAVLTPEGSVAARATSAAPRPRRCAPRSQRARKSPALGRLVRLRLVDPADLARLGPRDPVAHQAARDSALRQPLALAAAVAGAEGAPSLSSWSGERLAQRRDGVADAVGADVAGGVLPREAGWDS